MVRTRRASRSASPPDVVGHLGGLDVIEEAVHGEVAPAGVLFGRAEDVVAADQELFDLLDRHPLARVRPEGRGLDDLGAKEDVGEAEAPPDDPRVPEEIFDLVGGRGGGDVEVLGGPPQEEIADATADQVRDMTIASQPPQDLVRVGVNQIFGNGHSNAG
jgi:hypothetical protein